jgi:hypothetical protein
MVNPIKYCSNWYRLKMVERTVNKYRLRSSPGLRLIYKNLLARPVMNVFRVKINGTTYGVLVASQKKNDWTVTYIEFIWVNEQKTLLLTPDTESTFYQHLYEMFMQWHANLNIPGKVAITINITKEEQIERMRRILTLYGFNKDYELTLKDIEFKTPYREKEVVKTVTYSRIV